MLHVNALVKVDAQMDASKNKFEDSGRSHRKVGTITCAKLEWETFRIALPAD